MHEFLAGNRFFCSALIVSLAIYLRAGQPTMGWLIPLLCGAVLTFALAVPAPVFVQITLALCYWSLACIALQLALPLFRRGNGSRLTKRMLFAPVASLATVLFLYWSVQLTPRTLDLYFYSFDASLGFQPAFAAAQVLLANEWLRSATELVYMNLPLGLAWVYLWQEDRSAEAAARTLRFYLVLGAVGYTCYFIVPAVGPATVFPGAFPFHAPGLDSLRIAPLAMSAPIPRNCMPSLHTSWALAILWSANSMARRGRLAAGIFAGMTIFYACAAGGHYFADLVVALPFTLAVYAATRGQFRRSRTRAALVGGSLLFVAWLAALRWGYAWFHVSRVVPWSAVALTCIVVAALHWNLSRAEERTSIPAVSGRPSGGRLV